MSLNQSEFSVGNSVRISDTKYPEISGTFIIEQVNRYEQGGYTWFEGRIKVNGNPIFFEIEDEVSYVSLAEVTDQFSHLFSAFRNSGGQPKTLSFDHQTFALEESGKAQYFENDSSSSETFEFVEYKAGKQFITVEIWDEDDIEVWLSVDVESCEIIS